MNNYDPIVSMSIAQNFGDTTGSPASTSYLIVPSPMVTVKDLRVLYGVPEDERVTNENATQVLVN